MSALNVGIWEVRQKVTEIIRESRGATIFSDVSVKIDKFEVKDDKMEVRGTYSIRPLASRRELGTSLPAVEESGNFEMVFDGNLSPLKVEIEGSPE